MLAAGRVAGAVGLVIGLAAMALPAKAASFRSATAGAAPMVLISGEFAYGDGERFQRLAATLPKATTVVFDSPGGNLMAGLQIGETIRAKGYGTLVADGSVCASACAIAWLGGTKRYLSSGGRLGFHAASGENGISAPGNALVGAYMARLGLKADAVYALTAASPYDIAWLDFASARQLGIAVERYAGPGFAAPSYASTRAAPQVASRTGPARARPWSGGANGKSGSSWDDDDDGPAASTGHPAVRTSNPAPAPRACPAYTYGGHGGC